MPCHHYKKPQLPKGGLVGSSRDLKYLVFGLVGLVWKELKIFLHLRNQAEKGKEKTVGLYDFGYNLRARSRVVCPQPLQCSNLRGMLVRA
ncbi:hypothetical protein OOU_Y34scaffold00799g10 [Pyricularia oryzae Y34]|uniref:Uncharacterized protein n=2 Tax=Pyricularia oryzae TaxID=318829 RepID=A0AA97PGV7_PYRO3|nr:hypothetical protein OOU_Y34scaffold00799g10 [Pyricularia oryzae Y34]